MLWSQRIEALLRCAGDFEGIDETILQVKTDGVAVGVHTCAALLIDDAPDFAEAPAQLSSRIVGNIPEQFAKRTPQHRGWREGQVREESARLAGCRQRHREPLPVDRHRAEEMYLDG